MFHFPARHVWFTGGYMTSLMFPRLISFLELGHVFRWHIGCFWRSENISSLSTLLIFLDTPQKSELRNTNPSQPKSSKVRSSKCTSHPIDSMYGTCTYICVILFGPTLGFILQHNGSHMAMVTWETPKNPHGFAALEDLVALAQRGARILVLAPWLLRVGRQRQREKSWLSLRSFVRKTKGKPKDNQRKTKGKPQEHGGFPWDFMGFTIW